MCWAGYQHSLHGFVQRNEAEKFCIYFRMHWVQKYCLDKMNLQNTEQQVLNMSPDKIIDHFTFPTMKNGQRQNFTGIGFHRAAVSRWLLGATETSVKSVPVFSCERLHHLMWVTPEVELRRAFSNPSTTSTPTSKELPGVLVAVCSSLPRPALIFLIWAMWAL